MDIITGPLRNDVIIKTILRIMRKEYLKEFNKATEFQKYCNMRQPDFYVSSLELFASTSRLEQDSSDPTYEVSLNDTITPEEITICLGSMFHHKRMKAFHQDPQVLEKIESIHGLLYNFTPHKMEILRNQPTLKFLLKRFLLQKEEEVFETSQTLKKNILQYKSGFDHLKYMCS